jgi:hypothetical protein
MHVSNFVLRVSGINLFLQYSFASLVDTINGLFVRRAWCWESIVTLEFKSWQLGARTPAAISKIRFSIPYTYWIRDESA